MPNITFETDAANYESAAIALRSLTREYTRLNRVMKKPKITRSFEPGDLDGADEAQLKIWNLAVNEQNPQALAALDMLIVHFYAGDNSAPFAERYVSCMVARAAVTSACR